MKVHETTIAGALILEPDVFADARGFFLETYRDSRFVEAGIDVSFPQDNHSRSGAGVLRGLHYQITRPQGHLVTILTGAIFDVGLDLRRGSPSFGTVFTTELHADGPRQIWLPPGVAHGFCVLGDGADIHYKCSDVYVPGDEAGVAWDDPDLAIDWPLDAPMVAAKDTAHPRLRDIPIERLPHA